MNHPRVVTECRWWLVGVAGLFWEMDGNMISVWSFQGFFYWKGAILFWNSDWRVLDGCRIVDWDLRGNYLVWGSILVSCCCSVPYDCLISVDVEGSCSVWLCGCFRTMFMICSFFLLWMLFWFSGRFAVGYFFYVGEVRVDLNFGYFGCLRRM